MVEYFIITSESSLNTDEIKFYACDDPAGGGPYWSCRLESAKLFKLYKDANKVITEDMEFNREFKTSTGIIYPPLLISSGIGLNKDNLKGSLLVKIVKVDLNHVVKHFKFEGDVHKNENNKGDN